MTILGSQLPSIFANHVSEYICATRLAPTAHGESWATAVAIPDDWANPRETHARNGSSSCKDLMIACDHIHTSRAPRRLGIKARKTKETRGTNVVTEWAHTGVSISVESLPERWASEMSSTEPVTGSWGRHSHMKLRVST